MAFLLLLVFVILVLLFSLLFFLPYFFSTQISLHARCELYDTKVIYKRGNICLKFYLCWRKRDGRAKLRETKKKQSQQKGKCQKCTEYPQHTCHMYYTVRLSVHFVRHVRDHKIVNNLYRCNMCRLDAMKRLCQQKKGEINFFSNSCFWNLLSILLLLKVQSTVSERVARRISSRAIIAQLAAVVRMVLYESY